MFLSVLVFPTLFTGVPFYSYHKAEACLPSVRGSSAYGLPGRLRHPVPCRSHARYSNVPAGEPGNAAST